MKEIQLTLGQKAIVDDEDFDLLNQYKWFAYKDRNTYYACRQIRLNSGKQRMISMHRFLTGFNETLVVDHKDRNRLNNQRKNLRLVTDAQNRQNSSAQKNSKTGIKGVTFETKRNKWRVNIMINGKNRNIGRFLNIDDAIKARHFADITYHPFNTFPCGN